MSWSKPFTEDEITFVRESFGQLSPAEMAQRLGRSKRGVNNLISRLGLRASQKAEEPAPAPPRQAASGSQLDALLELRDILRLALLDAGPQSIPKVAREYRETLDEIERLRDGGESGPGRGEDAFDALLGAIGRKLSS